MAVGAVLFAYGFSRAENSEDQKIVFKMSDTAGLEIGQIEKGEFAFNNNQAPMERNHGWQERFLLRFINNVTVNDRIRVFMDIEGQISFSYPQLLTPAESEAPRYLFFPEHVEGSYSLGNPERPYLQFGVGFFPYKFDPDARNLGEFIYRTGTYPVYLISNFNHCYGKLLGFRTTYSPVENLNLDLLFTSNALMFPTQDYSLSALVHYDLFKCLYLGAGVCFDHLFSIEGKLTNGTSFQEALYQPHPGDTTHVYYSFAGTKPAVMVAFDPKALLPFDWTTVFGRSDGRIYGELCVSGWENRKNYDTAIAPEKDYYNNRLDRTMAMVGFKVPTCKMLDDLSLECEYFPPRYPDSWRQVFDENIPVPFIVNGQSRLPWKWSVYAKKTILNNFSIIAQAARDHVRPTFPDLKNMERETVLNKIDDWWWTISFNFFM
jgi:hypothetical protein